MIVRNKGNKEENLILQGPQTRQLDWKGHRRLGLVHRAEVRRLGDQPRGPVPHLLSTWQAPRRAQQRC